MSESDEVKVRKRRITDYRTDLHNANKGTERGLYMLERSLEEVGLGRSIVAAADGSIPAGNKTIERALEAGFEDVIEVETDGHQLVVVKRKDWATVDDPRARLYAYYDNRVAEVDLAWDVDQVAEDLQAGMDLSGMWQDDELEAMLAAGGHAAEDGDGAEDEPLEDRSEELLDKWGVEPGDVWVIPSSSSPGLTHRIVCGDSTNSDDLDRLMGGETADLLLTDPPYGISVVKGQKVGGSKPVTIGSVRGKNPYPFGGAKNKGKVGGGKMVDSSWYRPVIGDDQPFDPTPLVGFATHAIVFGGNYFASKLPDSRCWIVWDKNNTGHFADAELAWTDFDRGVKLYQFTWNGLVREGSRAVEGVHRMHPTQKPVGLMSMILDDFSDHGALVVDLYSGSGSVLLACELSGREGRAMEIDPAYVAVTLQRFANLGLTPERRIDG